MYLRKGLAYDIFSFIMIFIGNKYLLKVVFVGNGMRIC
jgi:hypothetical protein